MMHRRPTFVAAAALGATLFYGPAARANKPVQVYSVYWSSDLSHQAEIEQFMGCLIESSTFGSSWAAEWGVGPVDYHGAYVISAPAPNPLRVGGSLETALNAAIDKGEVPSPGTNYDTVYLAHGPSGVTCEGADGTVMCATWGCGEHGPATWQGRQYQEALVPLACNLCGGTVQAATWIGEHETGEALSWLGIGGFESGDSCEGQGTLTTLSCCGKTYVTQRMSKPSAPADCELITATGAACGCTPLDTACAKASDCCSGLTCQPWVAKIGDAPKNVCCDELGSSCSNTNGCCGGLSCKGGKCSCQATGDFCLRDIDCCNAAFCNGQKCGASWLPAQANGNDALSLVSWPADGHVEVFARTPGGDLAHAWSGNASWNAPQALGGGAECGLASLFWLPNLSSQDDYPEAFAPTTAGSTEHVYDDVEAMKWTSPSDFGGTMLAHLSTLTWLDGHSEVFALASDGAIAHDYFDFGKHDWSGWSEMAGTGGAKLSTGAGAILWSDGHAEIFAVDAQGAAWHSWSGNYPNGWHAWEQMSGGTPFAGRPAPVRWADGHVSVYVLGTDGRVYESDWTNGSWPAFASVVSGVSAVGDPSAVMTANGPRVFVHDSHGRVWTAARSGPSWAAPEVVEGALSQASPIGWAFPDGHLEVFGVDPSGALIHAAQSGSAWAAWETIGAGVDPCAPALEPLPDAGPGAGGGPASAGAGGSGGARGAGGAGGSVASHGRPGGCACGVRAARPRDGMTAAALVLLAATAARRRRRGRG